MSRAKEETKFLLTYKFRAYPSALMEYRMENWLYTLCNLYNHALEERKRAWTEERRSITYSDQQNNLPRLKRKDLSLKIVHSQVLQDCLRRVDNAFQKFFRKSAKYPKKKKLSGYNSFTFPQVWMKQKGKLVEVIKLEKKNSRFAYLHLPKLGRLKIRLHREIDWTKARTVTVKREPSGKWYVCITAEVELDEILKSAEEKAVGIDLGVKNLATTSEGEFIEHPKFWKKLEKRLKREQKKLSRKEKFSMNWEKHRKRVAKVHERVRNARRDFLHKLTRYLVNNYDYISFENLDIKGLVQNSNLAKSILDAGWGTLITFVTYKAVMAGARVVRVDPYYTTQDCSVCGFRVPKTLAERFHECPGCGVVMDRDYNASVNILQRGLTHLTGGRVGATRTYACGEGSGGATSEEGVSQPSQKQESRYGSSEWDYIPYRKLLP
ncbi:RNA-guided endonuclease InsQ/TnpB family protein [Hydrogenivirga sp.]